MCQVSDRLDEGVRGGAHRREKLEAAGGADEASMQKQEPADHSDGSYHAEQKRDQVKGHDTSPQS